MKCHSNGRYFCSVLIGLSGLLAGCDAFEYYGPIPNLREIVEVNEGDLGRLESLQLRGQSISSDAAREIRLASNLKSVVIQECALEDGRKLMESLGELPRLESLTIHRSHFTDQDFASLETAMRLNFVEILDSNLHGDGLRAISKLPIRSLAFNSDDARAEDLQCLADFEQLEELYINAPGLDLDRLPSLRKLQKLKAITLLNFGASKRDQSQTLAFLQDIGSLQRINLSSNCIEDGLMRSLAKLKSLEKIEILQNAITDEGIVALESLPSLKILTIWDARHITRDSLASLAKHQQLEALSLCGALIPISDRRLLDCLPNLTDVDVGMTPREIEQATSGGESLAYRPQKLDNVRNRVNRRQRSRPAKEVSM